MAWRGTFSRSLMTTARASSRSPASVLRGRPPLLAAPRFNSSRFVFTNSRILGEIGRAEKLPPLLVCSMLTSHLAVNPRAYTELSQVT